MLASLAVRLREVIDSGGVKTGANGLVWPFWQLCVGERLPSIHGE